VKRTLLVVAALTLTGVGAAVVNETAARDRTYRELIARGDTALAGDQTFAAIEAYSGAIALRPDSMLGHLRLAETYQRHGNLDEAAREFRRATNLDQTATRPFEELGDVLYQQERFDRATEAYARAAKLDDRSARVTYKFALAQYRSGDATDALRTVTTSIALDARSADAHYLHGLCLRDSHRPAEALQAFNRAVVLAPAMIAAHEELADLYHAAGRTRDELDQLTTLAALDRGRVERQIAVAMAHHRVGHSDLAVLTLGEAIERLPNDPALYGALGQVWLDRARDDRALIKKARQALERAATRPDASSHTLTAYARVLVLDGDTDAAGRVLLMATSRFPVDPDAFLQYAAVLDRQNRPDMARRALLQYTALFGDSDNPQFLALSRRLR
jgi:tetratricopeptide (TPR) repeat protein